MTIKFHCPKCDALIAFADKHREKAAKILGIGERTLYRKIKEYNL